jgi:RND family efflux transporter MFP subunit
MKLHLAWIPMSAFLLTSCGNDQASRAAQPPAAAVPVHVVAVTARDWPSTYEATGTVRARVTATISAKVMGYAQQVNFQVGDRLREGQTLVTVDARELEASLRRAQAGRAEVEGAMPEMDNAIASAKANLDLAQATYRRMDDLAAKKSISNQELDEASARLKAAQANYEMARARRTQLDSRLAQAEQEVRAAGIMRGYATVTAPFSGIVTAKSIEAGNMVTPGVPLLTVERDSGYRLEASIDESRLPGVRAGREVEVALDAADRRIHARVSEVVPSVDAASRSYTVRIDLPGSMPLRSGMFGRATFAVGVQKLAAIPAAALVERGQMQSVFVVDNGTARTRLVTIGRRSQDLVEVLSGLNPGEPVVSPIPSGLADGARVEVRQ